MSLNFPEFPDDSALGTNFKYRRFIQLALHGEMELGNTDISYPYTIDVLKEGYSIVQEGGSTSNACGTITLVKGPHNIIVDTGLPQDKSLILQGLARHELTADDVHYVVCTHGHSDHVGNLNLFPNATFIVGHDISKGDEYQLHDFKQGIPYEIDAYVEVIPTPGHTRGDVSVVVYRTCYGTVVIAGDTFEKFEDLEDSDIWQNNSELPEDQEQSRIEVFKLADYIIPGHGPMFKVPDEFKHEVKIVRTPTE
ncbi:unnamed protein product [Owenia fusiformis]|uniref:Metallo-beta-lactamase domain-containing protein 1 n=1 Tax=Owenia fusiformis TaxID=6347 RepID=A0A8S4NLU8_OWEFU|nr:unnamed protein product [Owenia fusiformis]